MFLRVFVYEFVDIAERNANGIAFRRLDLDGVVLITERQNGSYGLSLLVGNSNSIKGRFFCQTGTGEQTHNEQRGKDAFHGSESISDAKPLDEGGNG